VEAMRSGAANFLTKPYSAAELHKAVEDAMKEKDGWDHDDTTALIGNSTYMTELKESIRRIAQTDSSVLITGESGTGKELVARTIHNWSKRAQKPFIAVDCVSLVENLMESELFGHVKGAFSGAAESREGRFQMANGGTLFLDEIANISLTTQAKLLRFIQEREIPKVGKSSPERVDVRLITATNRDIRAEISAGKFREDLFYRISVVPINIKPLREHKSDIPVIAQFYLDHYRAKCNSKVKHFSEEAKKSLMAYLWPGNIRELRNTIERLCVLGDHEDVTVSDIFYYGQREVAVTPAADSEGRVTLVDVERIHIEKALQYFHFQINKTANFLGIDRKTLRMKIRNYGIKIQGDEK
jgi:DNA-binding NtrC family response regulator